ncbi:helix-turn-helix domain-containing protein [Bradyrhizobium sp. Lot11]
MEIADGEGITPTAHRLGVSKSIVSRRLARLEEELGVHQSPLTFRSGNGIRSGRIFPRLRFNALPLSRRIFGCRLPTILLSRDRLTFLKPALGWRIRLCAIV